MNRVIKSPWTYAVLLNILFWVIHFYANKEPEEMKLGLCFEHDGVNAWVVDCK